MAANAGKAKALNRMSIKARISLRPPAETAR